MIPLREIIGTGALHETALNSYMLLKPITPAVDEALHTKHGDLLCKAGITRALI